MTIDEILNGEARRAVGSAIVDFMLSEKWKVNDVLDNDASFEKDVTNHTFFVTVQKGKSPTIMINGARLECSYPSVEDAVKEANVLAATAMFGGWE